MSRVDFELMVDRCRTTWISPISRAFCRSHSSIFLRLHLISVSVRSHLILIFRFIMVMCREMTDEEAEAQADELLAQRKLILERAGT